MSEIGGITIVFLFLLASRAFLKYLDEKDYSKKTEDSEGWWDY